MRGECPRCGIDLNEGDWIEGPTEEAAMIVIEVGSFGCGWRALGNEIDETERRRMR